MTNRGGRSSRKRSHASSSSSSSSSPTIANNKTKRNGSRHHPIKQKRTLSRWKSLQQTLSLSSSTIHAMGILLFAILAGMAWNAYDGVTRVGGGDDPAIRSFLNRLCRGRDGHYEDHGFRQVYCHPSLVPRRRTQMAIRNIPQGERILELPRSLQIWDLDALRNDWIRQYLTGSKHRRTGNPVDSAAYLAVYLALLAITNTTTSSSSEEQQQKQHLLVHTTIGEEEMSSKKEREEILQAYLTDCMPTQAAFESFHPILWNDTELVERILPHTASFGVAKAYRDMIKSEYQAFTDAVQERTQDNLENFLTEQTYTRFRILVLSRSFGTGPLPNDSLSQDELRFYLNDFGIDLSRGCYAMVPILDFYDHHARPNVRYAFDATKQVFAIQVTERGILAGQEIVDNYGKYTDAHLFAKFGFVNGDGSGYSQASLATYHRVMDMDLQQQFSYLPFRRDHSLDEVLRKALDKQKEAMRKYLRFDDGYEECISSMTADDNNDYLQQAQELKKLKWQHLIRIANHAKRWQLVLLPRDPESLPARASNLPITYDPPRVTKRNTNKFFHRKEYHLLAATCRLISLTHEDYDGKAIELLQDNIHNNSFLPQSQLNENHSFDHDRDSLAAALEFRTHFCLARLASEAIARFFPAVAPSSSLLADMEDKVAKLNRRAFQTKEWTAAHLLLSEMHALETLRGVSFSAAREYEDLRNKYPAFTIRDSPCSDDDVWD